MSHLQRPRAARRAARLAVACLLLAFLAALFAPAATSAFGAGIRDSPSHTTATDTGAISAVHDLDAHPDGLQPVSSRNLLQFFPLWWYPPCQWGCRVQWRIWGWWFGFCQYNRRLYRCYRPWWWRYWPYWPFRTSTGALTLAGAADDSASTAEASGAPAQAQSAAVPAASGRSSFQQDLAASAPYAACSDDSDCMQLSTSSFGAVDGAEPAAVSGRLFSTCRRPSFVNDPSGVFDDFPGICMCSYISPNAPPGTLESVTGEPGPDPEPFKPDPFGPYVDPEYPEPYVDPEYPDERYVEPEYPDERYVEPEYPIVRYVEPEYPDERYVEPEYTYVPDRESPDFPFGPGGLSFRRRLQNFERFVTEDYCRQSSGTLAFASGGQDQPTEPFFVPGQPPVTTGESSAAAAPDGTPRSEAPMEADVETSEASISSGSIVGQAFVDGLPTGLGSAA